MNNYRNDEITVEKFVIIFISLVGLLLAIIFGAGSCSAHHTLEWNGGICPSCNVEYDLRAVHARYKYYVCPSCHNEIRRVTIDG